MTDRESIGPESADPEPADPEPADHEPADRESADRVGVVRGAGRAVLRGVGALKRAMYRGGRPGGVMRLLNRLDALMYGARWLPLSRTAVLKVAGRRSGAVTSVPVAVTRHRGGEYLVSMLGPDANWVRNVRAASGRAVLRRRGSEKPILLKEIPTEQRAEILRRYLAVAPGARPHLGLTPESPLPEFRRIAAAHPVFRIRPAGGDGLQAGRVPPS